MEQKLKYHVSKAVGIHPAEKGGVTLTTKKHKHLNRPAANKNEVSWGGNKSGPKSVIRPAYSLCFIFC